MQTFDSDTIPADRSDARALIIRAARALAEAKGVSAFNLDDVAAEARLPTPVVYGHFLCKDDLLLCIVADSVATLTARMGGNDRQQESPTTEVTRDGAVILSLPRTELAPETPEAMLEIANQVSAALRATSLSGDLLTAAGSDRRTIRRAERARISGSVERPAPMADVAAVDDKSDDESERTIEAAGDEKSVRTPGGVLARRLQALERVVAEIVARLDHTDKSNRTAAAIADDSAKHMLNKLAELIERVDDSEARQRAIADAVTSVKEKNQSQVQDDKGAVGSAFGENNSLPPVTTPAESDSLKLPIAGGTVAGTRADAPGPTEIRPALFAAARASAQTAGAPKPTWQFRWKASSEHSQGQYIAAGLAVTAIFVAAAGVAFNQGVHDGRGEALQSLAATTPSHAMIQTTANTPLDQLTARAQAGDSAAELAVATKYIDDSTNAYDPVAGFRWTSRAAQHGSAVAQYLLGTLYLKGIGTAKDPVQAMRWDEAAALQGNRKAMHDLAIAFAQGLGGTKNLSEAVRWLSRAANLGYVDSQFDLAVLYERGDGVPQSLLDAYKWYAIAGAQGDAEAMSRIEALRTQLSADDVAAAQHAADGFKTLPLNAAANLLPKT